MALSYWTDWEVRTTGNTNNGGGFFNRVPGASIDYSQQNASQLSLTDGACLLASVTLTSVIGGFTAGMIGNLIQIRAGGVNFVAGFYEIVLVNSANSVNLDRTPVAAGNGTGGLGEVGGAIASIETFIINGTHYNTCFVKSGTYTFTAWRSQVGSILRIFGYDISRTVSPTGNNRPLIQLSTFYIQQTASLEFENLRFTGSATQLILGKARGLMATNCTFENTNGAGARYCIYFDATLMGNAPGRSRFLSCEFKGTAGATSYGFKYVGQSQIQTDYAAHIGFIFCFFHDLTYGYQCDQSAYGDSGALFFKCIFARIGGDSIRCSFVVANKYPLVVVFCSFYGATANHLNIGYKCNNLIYGNTFDSAVAFACLDTVTNLFWHIDSNNFWNNGAPVSGCVLGVDNIGLNPLWVNPAGDDFNFGAGSPCIDNAIGTRLGV